MSVNPLSSWGNMFKNPNDAIRSPPSRRKNEGNSSKQPPKSDASKYPLANQAFAPNLENVPGVVLLVNQFSCTPQARKTPNT